ncbi:hypothetical protein [uncultured Tyzzerella sp.]|nr:hypothetical protein [uncultured Tyzzerella sp.]
MNNIKDVNFNYSLKVCKNKDGIRKFKICNNCNTANNPNKQRCIKCFRKI